MSVERLDHLRHLCRLDDHGIHHSCHVAIDVDGGPAERSQTAFHIARSEQVITHEGHNDRLAKLAARQPARISEMRMDKIRRTIKPPQSVERLKVFEFLDALDF